MLNNIYKFNIKDFLKKDFAHNPEDGINIANKILNEAINSKKIEIDFKGINTANTAFCNMLFAELKKASKTYEIKLINCNDLIIETFSRVKDNYDKGDIK